MIETETVHYKHIIKMCKNTDKQRKKINKQYIEQKRIHLLQKTKKYIILPILFRTTF